MNNPQIVPALLVPLIAWRVYRRIRRNIGRQKFNEKRTWTLVVLLSLLVVLIGYGAGRSGWPIWPLGVGLGGGLIVAALSYRFTHFEHAEEGAFYTPNPYLGVAVSLLLISRLVYRWMTLLQAHDSLSGQFGQSPVTLSLFGLTFGYYLASAVFLLYEFKRIKKT